MCYQQLNVKNPTTRYKSSVSPIYQAVPCGKCHSCRQSAQNEWFLRAYAEYVANTERGGVTFFVTLTYRNKDLPRFSKYGFDCNTACFDKAHLDTFIKNLHHYIALHYGGHSEGLRYLHCCEYGSHTKRPHYHCLIYFPPMGLVSDASLKSLIDKSWSHGWVLYSKQEKGGPRISSDKGIKYVSKYVTKDLSFYNLPSIVALSTEMSKLKKYDKGTPERERYRLFRSLMPRHYQSQLFGFEVLKRCFVDYIDDDGNYLLSKDIEYALSKGYRIPLTTDVYAIPRYVLNRLCYDTNSKGERFVNKVGKCILTKVINHRIHNQANQLAHDLTVIGIESLCPSDKMVECFTAEDAPAHFAASNPAIQNAVALNEFVQTLINGRPLDDIILYDLVFRNRSKQGFVNSLEYADLDLEVNGDNITDIADALIFQRYHNLSKTRDYPEDTPPAMRRKKVREYEEQRLFDDDAYFRDFNAILAIYKTLQRWSQTHRAKGRFIHNDRVDRLRDKLNSYNILKYVS